MLIGNDKKLGMQWLTSNQTYHAVQTSSAAIADLLPRPRHILKQSYCHWYELITIGYNTPGTSSDLDAVTSGEDVEAAVL